MSKKHKRPAKRPPIISTEYIFDKFFVAKQIMESPKGGSAVAPESVIARNVETLNHWLEIWGVNMFINSPLIMKDYGFDVHRRRATREAGTESAEPYPCARPDLCIIAGSGPSLDDYLPYMKNWPGLIIASTTNACSFLAHGIVPHYILAVDANPELAVYLENIAQAPGAERSKLLLPVTADPETALAWPFARYWHMDFIQGGRDLNNPFNSFQCMLFPFMKFYLTQAGSVVNCAAMLPKMWGEAGLLDIRKVFLFGVDCGFPGGRSRSIRYKYDAAHAEYDAHEPPPVEAKRNSPALVSANGTPSEEAQLGYKRSLLTVWWAMHFRDAAGDATEESRRAGMFHLYSCSHGVMEDVLPHLGGREVIESAGACAAPYDRKFVDLAYHNYLTKIAPLEAQGFEENMPGLMKGKP